MLIFKIFIVFFSPKVYEKKTISDHQIADFAWAEDILMIKNGPRKIPENPRQKHQGDPELNDFLDFLIFLSCPEIKFERPGPNI